MIMFMMQLIALLGFAIVLMFASISMHGELQKRKRVEREKIGKALSRKEFDEIYNKYIVLNIVLVILFLVSVFMTFIFKGLYLDYLANRVEFSLWVENAYSVPVDKQRADQIECYLNVLHYSSPGDKGLPPYSGMPACNQEVFKNKKERLGLVGTQEKLKLLVLGTLFVWFLFLLGLIISRLIIRPQYQWLKMYFVRGKC